VHASFGEMMIAGEEVFFRGPAPLVPHLSGCLLPPPSWPGTILSPGSNGHGTVRAATTEVLAAASLLALVVYSSSVYPVVVAHLISNLPGFAVELQREDLDTPWTP